MQSTKKKTETFKNIIQNKTVRHLNDITVLTSLRLCNSLHYSKIISCQLIRFGGNVKDSGMLFAQSKYTLSRYKYSLEGWIQWLKYSTSLQEWKSMPRWKKSTLLQCT